MINKMNKIIVVVGVISMLCCSNSGQGSKVLSDLGSDKEEIISEGLFFYMIMPTDFRIKNIDYLIPLLNHKNIKIRHTVTGVIGDIFLDYDRKEEIRRTPLYNKKRINFNDDCIKASTKVVPILIKQLGDANPSIIAISITAISDIGSLAKDAVPQLIKIIENGENELRAKAIIALGNIGSDAKDAIPILEKIATSGNANLSNLAIRSLSEIKNDLILH
ncbi:MAG: hypothetical protein CVV49_09665 [Spirochaetae bacterium HGW-Spirochaetae-5]|nr:MAG: hypothetical protein CVV49_09665 [Spirochaetae bacterium HGW-Spirochaetae-5]